MSPQYCDSGSLLDQVRSGAFRQPCASSAEQGAMWPALVPLYTSLLEVALALRHMHSKRLVHCDVKAANVLLKSSARDPRGWSCKLSDFGWCVRACAYDHTMMQHHRCVGRAAGVVTVDCRKRMFKLLGCKCCVLPCNGPRLLSAIPTQSSVPPLPRANTPWPAMCAARLLPAP